MRATRALRALAALAAVLVTHASTLCTTCYEDFSGLLLRRGAGGGAVGPLTAPTGRNEPSQGWRIDFRAGAIANGNPSWSWTPGGALQLALAPGQGSQILPGGAGTYGTRPPAAAAATGTAPPAGACAGAVDGSVYVSERWGLQRDFLELAVDVSAVTDGSPIVGLVFNYRDANNYYAVVSSSRSAETCTGVFKVAGGVPSALGAALPSALVANSTPGGASVTTRLHVSKAGNTIRVWANGRPEAVLLTAVDGSAAPLGAGLVGVWAAGVNAAQFDNLLLRGAPTCSDGLQNGEEDGIDCGGGCPTACAGSTTVTETVWDGSGGSNFAGWARETHGSATGAPNWNIVESGPNAGMLTQTINTGLAFQGAPGGNSENWHGGAFLLCVKCGRSVDMEIEIENFPVDNDWNGVVGRMTDRDNFYQFNTRQESVSTAVHRRRSGVNTVLHRSTQRSYTPSTWWTLRMRVVGGRVSVFYDGELWVDVQDDDPLLVAGLAGIFITNQDNSLWRRARVTNFRPVNALCQSAYTGLTAAGQAALAINVDAGRLTATAAGVATQFWGSTTPTGLAFYHSPYYTSFNALPLAVTTPRGNALAFARSTFATFLWAAPRYEADIVPGRGLTLLLAFSAAAVSTPGGVLAHKGGLRGVLGWALTLAPGNVLTFSVAATGGANAAASVSTTFTPDQVSVVAVRVAPLPGDAFGTHAVTASLNGAPFANATDATFNGTSSLGGSSYLYLGASEEMTTASRFVGVLYEAALFAAGLADADVSAGADYLSRTYGAGRTCPSLLPLGDGVLQTGGVCSGAAAAGDGCRLACAPGYRLTSGSLNLTCGSGRWSAAAPFCEATCPDLTAPNTARSSCARGVFGDGFTTNATLSRWTAYPPAPNPWALAPGGGGALVGGGATVCGVPDSSLQQLVVETPSWGGTLFPRVRVSARLRFDRSGTLLPRWVDPRTYYAFTLSAEAGTLSFVAVRSGAATQLCNTSAFPVAANTWYTIAVEMGDDGSVAVTRNGVTVCRASTAALPYGSAGVAKPATSALTVAGFTVEALGPCPAGCTNMTAGSPCTLTCDPGLLPLAGNASRTCTPGGNYTGSPLVCGYAAPVFPSLAVAVPENSPAGTLVATANATLPPSTPGTILYEIVGGNAGGAFAVEPCSGALRVATSAMLDYEQAAGGLRAFTLQMRGYVAGITPPAEALATVDVAVTDVNDAPRLGTTACSVPENSPPGTLVCTLAATDEDAPPQAASFALTFASGDGLSVFALNAATGALTIRAGGSVDYEATPSYTLTVRVSDAGNAALFTTGQVVVSVLNVNEPPLITSPAVFEVDQSAAPSPGGGLIGGPLTATDPDAGNSVTFTLAANALAALGGGPGGNTLVFASPRTYTAAPFERDGRLLVDYAEVTLTAIDSGTPSPLSATQLLRIYVLANVTGNGLPVVRAMEVRPAVAAAGSGSLGGGAHTINTDGSDAVYLGASGVPSRTGDVVTAWANTTTGGVPRGWNATCTYSLGAVPGQPALNGYIVCPTRAGWGPGWSLRLTVSVDGQPAVPVPASIVLGFGYALPVVTSVLPEVPDAAVTTAGGTAMIISGYNLGGGSAPFACSYGPCNTTAGGAGSATDCDYAYSFTRAAATHTTVRVLTAPGVGTTLRLLLSVGGQTVAPAAVGFGYALPVVTSVSLPGGGGGGGNASAPDAAIHALSGSGGATLLIRGANFGPSSTQPADRPLLSLGPAGFFTPGSSGPLPFVSPEACSYPVPSESHTLIACIVPPGLGANHSLLLRVGGAWGAAPTPASVRNATVSYAPPVITGLGGAGAKEMDTTGGQVLTLSVANAGPPEASGSGSGAVYPPPEVVYGAGNATDNFTATGCATTGAGGTSAGVACLTGEGSGGVGGLLFRVRLGGQWSEPFRAASTKYAPPVVTGFDAGSPGAADAATSGFQRVVINGRNFGPNSSDVAVEYETVAVYAGVETRLVFRPPAPCTRGDAGPHTSLVCLTAPGAGAPLAWTVVVSGQRSTQPTTNYADPAVHNVTTNTAPYRTPVTAASTEGGTVVRLRGLNFGPPASPALGGRPLVQDITYGPPEDPYRPTAFTVLDHSTITLTLRPGIGANLPFRIAVAGQVSAVGAVPNASLSYALPRVFSLAPATAPTAGGGVVVRVNARGVGMLDAGTDHVLTLGGREVTIVERYPSRAAVESGNLTAAMRVPANHYLAFAVPPYAGPRLPVVVTAYRRTVPSVRVVSTPATDGAGALFSYTPPSIGLVTVQPVTDPAVYALLNASFGPGFDAADARLLTVACANAGPSAALGRLEVQLVDAFGRPDPADPSWNPARAVPLPGQWSHDRIVAVTSVPRGNLRIAIAAYTLAGAADPAGAALSNAVSFTDLAPVVTALNGTRVANFSTAGGDVVVLGVANLGSAQGSVNATVAGRPAVIVDDAGTPLDAGGVVTSVVAPQVAAAAGAGLDAGRLVVRLRMVIPAGQGASAPVVVYRDGVPGSSSSVVVRYAPPTLATAAVTDAGTNATTVVIGGGGGANATAAARAVIRVPTAGGRVAVTGTNLGDCPVVRFGLARGAACAGDALPGDALTIVSRDHSSLVVDVPAGEGDGTAYGGWRFEVAAGDQTTAVAAGYQPAVVTAAVGAPGVGLPTTGGVTLTLVGANFGRPEAAPPIVSIRLGGVDGAVAYCDDAVRDPVTPHARLTCTLPAGSGANLTVAVTVGDVTGVSPSVLTYDGPRIVAVATLPGVTGAAPTNASAACNATALAAAGDGAGVPPAAAFTGPAGGPPAGGYLVSITGSGFGLYSPGSLCVFLASTRDGTALRCNGVADNYAEHEVPPGAIVSWTHERIVFCMPPGAGGLRYVYVVARGQRSVLDAAAAANATGALHRPDVWVFDPPVLVAITPAALGTEGGEAVVLTGYNFGLGPTAAANVRRATADYFLPAPLPLPTGPDAGLPSGVALRVNFFSASRCVSSAVVDDDNTRPAAVAACVTDATAGAGAPPAGVLEHSDSRIVFTSLPGVGVRRPLSLSLVNTDGQAVTSQPLNVSYAPPTVARVAPSLVALREARLLDAVSGRTDAVPVLTTVFGANYGGADTAGWSDDEKALDIWVDGARCDAPARVLQGTAVGLQCQLGAASLAGGTANLSLAPTVGMKSVVVRVAGQTSPPSHPTLLTVVCENGYYALPGEVCLAVPPGSTSWGWDASRTARLANRTAPDGSAYTECLSCYGQPVAEPGYFNMKGLSKGDGTTDATCHPQRAREGRTPVQCDHVVRCEPPEACLGANVCADGYASTAWPFRCSQCAPGFYRSSGVCKKCPAAPELNVLVFFLAALAAIGLGYFLNQKAINLMYLSIGLDFFQVIAVFAETRVGWPPAMQELFRIFAAFNLNLETVNLECSLKGITYTEKWAAVMVLPVAVFVLLGVVHASVVIFTVCVKRQRAKQTAAAAAPLVSMALVLCYVLYLYIARTVFDVFTCRPTVPADFDASGAEIRYMAGVFERCGVPGGTQLRLLPWAIVALAVYVVGYPAGLAALLWRNRELVMEDQLLRAKGAGDDRLTNPHAYLFRRMFSRVYYQFRPAVVGWVLAIILRKFLIAIAALVFSQNASFQMAAMLLVLFGAYAAQARVVPYMSPGAGYEAALHDHRDRLRKGSALHLRLEATLCQIAERGRKKSRSVAFASAGMLSLRTATPGQVANLTLAWLTDANTVESTMLSAAMLVCIFGILFASSANSIGANASSFFAQSRDGVLGACLAVIILATLYWLFVVVFDVWSAVTADSSRRRAEEARRRKRASSDLKAGGGGKGGLKVAIPGGGSDADPSGSGDLDGAAIHRTDSSFNPLFITADGKGLGAAGGAGGAAAGLDLDASGGLGTDVVAAMVKPPDASTWLAVRESYLAALAANGELVRQLATARNEAVSPVSPLSPGGRGSSRAEFQPMTIVGHGAASAAHGGMGGAGSPPGSPLAAAAGGMRRNASSERDLSAYKSARPVGAAGGGGGGATPRR